MARFGQTLCGLKLTLCVDDLGPPFAFRFGLLGHRTLHAFRQLKILQLHHRHLDAPGLGLLIDNLLQAVIDLLPLRKQLIQIGLP